MDIAIHAMDNIVKFYIIFRYRESNISYQYPMKESIINLLWKAGLTTVPENSVEPLSDRLKTAGPLQCSQVQDKKRDEKTWLLIFCGKWSSIHFRSQLSVSAT